MKLNKIIKNILINILIILLLLLITETVLIFYNYYYHYKYNKAYSPEEKQKLTISQKIYDFKESIRQQYFINDSYTYETFRRPSGEEYKVPGIILFGCSYAYGTNLEYNDTFANQLSTYIKAPVYNLGIPGGGPREILYILRNKDIINHFKINTNKVNFVIYLYIGDHQRRIYVNQRPIVPDFKEKNNSLILKHNNKFLQKRWIYTKFKEIYTYKFISRDASWKKEVLYLKEINKEIHNTFKNDDRDTKFVVLDYTPWGNENWDDLKNEDIIIIHINELADIKQGELPYIVWEGDDHPSRLVWELTIPELVKKLNLK